jgi:hypothetical protein
MITRASSMNGGRSVRRALLRLLPLRERARWLLHNTLMGEGLSSSEGVLAKKPPHPTFPVKTSKLPSPAGGEGTTTKADLAPSMVSR